MRAVMAFSGGMDSTGLLMRLLADGFKVSCVTYNYGQRHIIEIDRAINNIKYLMNNGIEVEHKIVDISSAMSLFHSSLISGGEAIPEGHYEEKQMKSTVVPNRNAIFSSILYGYAISIAMREETEVKIALGVHSGDHMIYPDCRPEFYESLEKSFSLGNWGSDNVTLYLPYIEKDKEFILRDALISCKKLGIDFDTVFANTNTSYNPDENGRSSGTSGADVERILAFHAIGRKDPVEYVKKMLSLFLSRRDLIVDLLNQIRGVSCFLPGGAFYAFPDFSTYLGKRAEGTLLRDTFDISEYILKFANVVTVPGDGFGAPGHIRFSYATNKDTIKEGIKRVKSALEKIY